MNLALGYGTPVPTNVDLAFLKKSIKTKRLKFDLGFRFLNLAQFLRCLSRVQFFKLYLVHVKL